MSLLRKIFDGMINSEAPDQTASLVSVLLVFAILSEKLMYENIWIITIILHIITCRIHATA